MLARPGITAKKFIDGKRKNYQPPVSYFLVWITVYILSLYLITKFFGDNVVINYKDILARPLQQNLPSATLVLC